MCQGRVTAGQQLVVGMEKVRATGLAGKAEIWRIRNRSLNLKQSQSLSLSLRQHLNLR